MVLPPATPKPKRVKGWTRLFGICRSNERDLAVIAVRRKTLSVEERRIKKEAARNDEHVGEVEDACLCWRHNGQWHRVTDFAGRITNVWFRDGQLSYAQNVEVREGGKLRRFARVRTLSAPQDVVFEAEVPREVCSFRIGDDGMLVVGCTRGEGAWVRDWGGQWRALPDDGAPRGTWGSAACADQGYWVSWGDTLRHWHDGTWRSVIARGAQQREPWVSVSAHGSRVAAIQGGELWLGDRETVKPVPLVPAPQMVWFDGEDIIVGDKSSGLHRFVGEAHDAAGVTAMPQADAKGNLAWLAARSLPAIARSKHRLWARESDDWVEVPLVPMWEAVGIESLRWETHREETWLPIKRKPRPTVPTPRPVQPRDVLSRVLSGEAPLKTLTAAVATGPDIVVSGIMSSKHTPLGFAAWAADKPRVLARMVSLGADVNGVSGDGRPPLVSALGKDNDKNVAWLLKHGALPSLPSAIEVDGKTVEPDSALAYAAYRGKRAVLEKMLAMKPTVTGTFNGETALAVALFRGHDDLVELLQAHGVPIRAQGPGSRSPLREFFKDRPELIESFMEEMRDDFTGEGGSEALIEMLVHQSLGRDKQALIDLLLDNGARATTARALRLAVETGQLRALAACLAAGANTGLRDALDLALRQDPIDAEVVQLLVTHGADYDVGDTGALFAAVVADDAAAARVLVEAGADAAKLHYDPKNMRADPLTAHAHAVRLEADTVAAYLETLDGAT